MFLNAALPLLATEFAGRRLRVRAGWLVLLASCLWTVPSSAQQSDYVIGPQDVLTIAVWEQPDLSGKFAVEADGTLAFPLIGRIKAGGQTLRDVEADLRKRLMDGYLKNPQVTVAVEQYRSQRIFVVGEVREPGTYPLTGDMTLIEALARAGSTSPTASGEAVIVRAPKGKPPSGPTMPSGSDTSEVLRVDLKMLEGGDLSQNIRLRDGDTIFLPKNETVYIFGQVRAPGAYAIQKGTTVLQALSLAGGISDRGSTARIKIIRIVDGKKKEIKVGLNDPVRPGDTIVVPERFF